VVGRREKTRIKKENHFVQLREMYRSWVPDRQDGFVLRYADVLAYPKVCH
jgi:hypothetical protein